MEYFENKNPLIWVEIDKGAIEHNISAIKSLLNDNVSFCAVVKSNAYGHGILEVSRIALGAGAGWLGVNSLSEAKFLRKNGFNVPIIILGYVQLNEYEEIIENDLRCVIYNLENLREFDRAASKLNRTAYVHLKLETGTNRQGIAYEDLPDFAKLLKASKNLKLEGLSTHFANIDDTSDQTYADFQKENFNRSASFLEEDGFKIDIKHTACSAAAILFPETYHNMVRVGISMYGMWPSRETYLSSVREDVPKIEFKPALTWKTKIAQIKTIGKGEYVGYGCSWRSSQDNTKIAVCPVGYFDGYDRLISNNGYVIIGDKRAPICGRVCMNIIMVDVTHIEGAALEDEVILLGSTKSETISAELMASWIGTINYEVTTRINPLLPRITN
ncbi:alanine racemase [Spirochaetota bacterium]